MITKGDVVGPALEFEHGIKQKMDVKPTIRLEVKPTFQVESKAGKGNHNFRSAGQIVQEQRGNLRVANKQFSNVNNDYEMTLNANSEVEEVPEDAASIQMPAMKY
ncbi:unnamed protein product [Sphagnum troendelagicum]